jgi:ABC-type Fe3+ transport system permease subunit
MPNPRAGRFWIEGRPVPMRWQTLVFGAMAFAAGLLATAPLASLIVLAFGETGDLWPHLARYVIPAALVETALLLAGVAAVTIIIGASTAWLVTTFAFPGRDAREVSRIRSRYRETAAASASPAAPAAN